MKFRAAGVRIVTEQTPGRRGSGLIFQPFDLESFVALGMTPAQAIVAATRDAAGIAQVNSGMVAAGKNADFIVLMQIPWRIFQHATDLQGLSSRTGSRPGALKTKWQAAANRAAK
jgi:imidazolonepropionase-like amidohydrolase